MQGASETERSALSAAIAPLQALAARHVDGPAAYALDVAAQLVEAFLATEERFNCGATEQEVIDSLRQVGSLLGDVAFSRVPLSRNLCSSTGERRYLNQVEDLLRVRKSDR